MFGILFKSILDSILAIHLLSIFGILNFEVTMYCLCKFLDEVDQELKSIGVYFPEFIFQDFFIGC
jgi:hypothetical protein